jgi:hypothetical protein
MRKAEMLQDAYLRRCAHLHARGLPAISEPLWNPLRMRPFWFCALPMRFGRFFSGFLPSYRFRSACEQENWQPCHAARVFGRMRTGPERRTRADPGPTGPRGESGPAGPPGARGEQGRPSPTIRVVRANCLTGVCMASCREDEILVTAYCGPTRQEETILGERQLYRAGFGPPLRTHRSSQFASRCRCSFHLRSRT